MPGKVQTIQISTFHFICLKASLKCTTGNYYSLIIPPAGMRMGAPSLTEIQQSRALGL